MAPAALDPKIFTVRPDPFDQADHLYTPPLLSLPPRCLPDGHHRALIGVRGQGVRNQGMVPACTAVALAHLIDYQRLCQQPLPSQEASDVLPLAPVSARMLFEMAKAFDEFPDDEQQGSTLRGVLRGFRHNGVCLADDPPDDELSPDTWKLTIERAKQARGIVLGTYARLRHELLDHQAAVQQLGAVIVSAHIHSGWLRESVRKERGRILYSGEISTLGHAFVIVGYTEEGFLVLNSHGRQWGGWREGSDSTTSRWPGIALWLYEDWHQNRLDSWVIQLGVPLAREHFFAVGSQFGRESKVSGALIQGVNRILVNGHYLHVSDGQMVQRGVYPNDLDSVKETSRHLAPPVEGDRSYRQLLLWVESGLDPIETMMGRTAVLVAHLKRRLPTIYPMAVIWRRDVLQLTSDLLEARSRRLESRTHGNMVAQGVMLEAFAKEFLPPIWRTFEGEAERSFHRRPGDPIPRGESWVALQQLLEAVTADPEPMDVHLVAHGSGVVWLQQLADCLARLQAQAEDAEALPNLASTQQRRLRIRSVDLITPLITTASLRRMVKELWGEAPPAPTQTRPPLAVYQRRAELDRREVLGGFPGSFLELARRCFPLDGLDPAHGNYIPIAGHSETTETLGSAGGFLQSVLITDSSDPVPEGTETVRLDPVPSHAELINDSRLLDYVLRRSGLESKSSRSHSAQN